MRTAADLVSDSESGNARKARGDANPAVGATWYYGASGGISHDAKLVAAPSSRNVNYAPVRSTGQCNTACSLSAGVWKPKVFRGR
jgi:hypothetical protein